MIRRLLVAGTLLISLAAGAGQAFAADIPDDPDTRPPGVTSLEPEFNGKKADFIPAVVEEPTP